MYCSVSLVSKSLTAVNTRGSSVDLAKKFDTVNKVCSIYIKNQSDLCIHSVHYVIVKA